MGMGTMLGFGLGTIKEQFKTPSLATKNRNSDNNSSGSSLTGFVSRVKGVINPSINLSSETDYNGNNNPIRNVIPTQASTLNNPTGNSVKSENVGNNNTSSSKFSKAKNIASGIAKTGYSATKAYLQVGANMAEGNFNLNKNSYKTSNSNNNYKKDFPNTEYANTASKLITPEKGDENELKTKD